MPKKTATARGAAHRNKPKVHKSVELVRQPSEKKASLTESNSASVAVTARSDSDSSSSVSSVATTAKATPVSKETLSPKNGSLEDVSISASKMSASARLAARRQAAQKSQRTSVNLISAENYSYVPKDLIFIAILAAVMFSVIIILHFVPAIGG